MNPRSSTANMLRPQHLGPSPEIYRRQLQHEARGLVMSSLAGVPDTGSTSQLRSSLGFSSSKIIEPGPLLTWSSLTATHPSRGRGLAKLFGSSSTTQLVSPHTATRSSPKLDGNFLLSIRYQARSGVAARETCELHASRR